MSKLFSGKKLKLKPLISLNKSAQNINQNIDDSIGITSLSNNINGLSPFNNNITIDYLNHYSPTNKSPMSLPPISRNTQNTNSQKKFQNINKTNNNILLSPKKLIQKKTVKNKVENSKITNLIKLNTEGKNEENKNSYLKTIDININRINKKRDYFYFSLFNNYKENNNINKIGKEKNIFLNKINKINLNKLYNIYSSPKNINQNNSLKTIENNIEDESKILNENISPNNINYNNNNNLSNINNNLNKTNIANNSKNNIINEIIREKVEKEKDKNKVSNSISLPTINQDKLPNIFNNINKNNNSYNNISKFKSFENSISNIIKEEEHAKNETKKEEKEEESKNERNDNRQIDYTNTDNIDTTLNFLKDLTTDKNNTFINFLNLIQTNLNIELFFDSLKISNNMNSFRKKKPINNINFNFISISSIKIQNLKGLLNSYFNILSNIYKKKVANNNTDDISYPIDSFFLFPIINNIFHKCLKVQICLYSTILISLNQLTEYEINLLIKNYLTQLIKQISFPLLLIYENFIKDEVNLKYLETINKFLKPEFSKNFEKLFQEKKIQRKNNCISNTQLIQQISKDLDKCIYSIQYYSSINIKNSSIKIFGDCLNQIINSIDIKTLNQFVIIFLETILYSELEENRKKVKPINSTNITITNNIKDYAPFLPEINQKYKYTLVLDMDETLVHFFFTKNLGMFFIRPYCFEFLNQLNEFYEIITFTAGTKEYADNILNLLDPGNEIIKYRLYRQHVTILGCSIYKDLNKLGRDLSKVIIIDNMKENFKMQPNNGLYVKTWINDINDYQFKDLLKILKDIVLLKALDVRPIIQKINEKISKENNLINPYYNINLEAIINEIKR